MFAEWAVGGLTSNRLRLLAARVVAVDAMIAARFHRDVFRMLRGPGLPVADGVQRRRPGLPIRRIRQGCNLPSGLPGCAGLGRRRRTTWRPSGSARSACSTCRRSRNCCSAACCNAPRASRMFLGRPDAAGADCRNAQRDRAVEPHLKRNSNADRLFRQRHGEGISRITRRPCWPMRRPAAAIAFVISPRPIS